MSQNFFDLFELPEDFNIDLEKLDQHYQRIQKDIHPDRFASSSSEIKTESVKKTAQVNDAYQTLKSPVRRAEYLLRLAGVHMDDDKFTAVPQDFLMQQMEWREELETHKDNKAHLEKLLKDVINKKNEMMHLLPNFFNQKMLLEAIKVTHELHFIEKMEHHIHDALIETI